MKQDMTVTTWRKCSQSPAAVSLFYTKLFILCFPYFYAYVIYLSSVTKAVLEGLPVPVW